MSTKTRLLNISLLANSVPQIGGEGDNTLVNRVRPVMGVLRQAVRAYW
jgi:hypothetical protein